MKSDHIVHDSEPDDGKGAPAPEADLTGERFAEQADGDSTSVEYVTESGTYTVVDTLEGRTIPDDGQNTQGEK